MDTNRAFMQFINKRVVVITLCIVLLIVVVIAFITNSSSTNKVKQPKITSYMDSDSGQTVTDIEGRTPENFNTDPDQPIFLGFTSLLSQGVSQYQLNGIEAAITTYSKQQKFAEISLKIDTIKSQPRQQNNTTSTIQFDIKFDRKPVYYKTTVELIGISKVRIVIHNGEGLLLFDSGVIDTSNLAGSGRD